MKSLHRNQVERRTMDAPGPTANVRMDMKAMLIAFLTSIALLYPVIADGGGANPYEAEEMHLKPERNILTTPNKYNARFGTLLPRATLKM